MEVHSIENVREEYSKRNKITQTNEEDERLIKAISNLRKNYADVLSKRKSVILIDPREAFVAPVIKQEKTKETKKQKKNVPKVEIVYCQATKMDGAKCTAKAKIGCVFCGRHLPKDK